MIIGVSGSQDIKSSLFYYVYMQDEDLVILYKIEQTRRNFYCNFFKF